MYPKKRDQKRNNSNSGAFGAISSSSSLPRTQQLAKEVSKTPSQSFATVLPGQQQSVDSAGNSADLSWSRKTTSKTPVGMNQSVRRDHGRDLGRDLSRDLGHSFYSPLNAFFQNEAKIRQQMIDRKGGEGPSETVIESPDLDNGGESEEKKAVENDDEDSPAALASIFRIATGSNDMNDDNNEYNQLCEMIEKSENMGFDDSGESLINESLMGDLLLGDSMKGSFKKFFPTISATPETPFLQNFLPSASSSSSPSLASLLPTSHNHNKPNDPFDQSVLLNSPYFPSSDFKKVQEQEPAELSSAFANVTKPKTLSPLVNALPPPCQIEIRFSVNFPVLPYEPKIASQELWEVLFAYIMHLLEQQNIPVTKRLLLYRDGDEFSVTGSELFDKSNKVVVGKKKGLLWRFQICSTPGCVSFSASRRNGESANSFARNIAVHS